MPRLIGPIAAGHADTPAMQVLRRLELECHTREQADDIADVVAPLLPDPVTARLGIVELLLNAIEHGNLEIGGARKYELLREHRFEDELAARLQQEPFRTRRVRVVVTVEFPAVEIEIHDDGPGFPWRSVLAADLECTDQRGGRGIAIVSRACFPGLQYRDPGNVAVVKVTWPQ
jgi:anti-sigma regulatory factor (Ser/Thr protein kinase)